MKKSKLFILPIIIFGLLLISCGGGKYSDLKSVTNAYMNAIDNFVEDANNVKNASDAAEALNNYADEMEKIMPTLKKMGEKYPELKKSKSNGENANPVIAEINKKMKNKIKEFIPAMIKLMRYANDPEVRKASKRLRDIGRK